MEAFLHALAAAGLDGDLASTGTGTPNSTGSDNATGNADEHSWRLVWAKGGPRVDLSDKRLSDTDLDDLAAALAENSTLEHLLLGSNHIDSVRLTGLVQSLAVRVLFLAPAHSLGSAI
jgi:hypothetical protein